MLGFMVIQLSLISSLHTSAAPYDDKLPVGCGYRYMYMKWNAIGHSQQPANKLGNFIGGIPT